MKKYKQVANAYGELDENIKMALGDGFEFLADFDAFFQYNGLISPFGNAQGKLATGKGKGRLDKATSSLILRGLGLTK
jgi:hypothetical protein